MVGAVLLAFDMTAQAFAERSRREFTANVSHELKTPLQGIIGRRVGERHVEVKPEDMPRFVGHIRAEAQRLVTLIGDIIRLSGAGRGAASCRPKRSTFSRSRRRPRKISAPRRRQKA